MKAEFPSRKRFDAVGSRRQRCDGEGFDVFRVSLSGNIWRSDWRIIQLSLGEADAKKQHFVFVVSRFCCSKSSLGTKIAELGLVLITTMRY